MVKQSTLEGSFDIPSDQDLRNLIVDSIPETAGLVSLKGFKMDLSANREFRKFFFAARCECKTSALLSVEIAENKKLEEVTKQLQNMGDTSNPNNPRDTRKLKYKMDKRLEDLENKGSNKFIIILSLTIINLLMFVAMVVLILKIQGIINF